MEDLTVIMCTPNLVPGAWAAYHREMLLEAVAGAPIIVISKKPADWGAANLIQEGYGLTNLYWQVLRGARLADTAYIATCDDDTLYPAEHFRLRPPPGLFGYNLHRWHLFTWGEPFFFHKPRPGGGLMIASRELVVGALEARYRHAVDHDGELPGRLCHELGSRSSMDCDGARWAPLYTSGVGVVSFYHEASVDRACQSRKKKIWPVRAYELPKWGRAEDLKALWR